MSSRKSLEKQEEMSSPRKRSRHLASDDKRTTKTFRNGGETNTIDPSLGNTAEKKTYRSCDKAGCNVAAPVCVVCVSDKCAKSGYTSRWHHISSGEHFCNECFEHFYRSYKSGYREYTEWKNLWTSNSRTDATVKLYIADRINPYWVQCTNARCRKWRPLPREIEIFLELVMHFKCDGVNGCQLPQDSRVDESLQPCWIETLLVAPLFRNAPTADFLGAFYPDGVGLSPTCTRCIKAKIVYQECRKQEQENSQNSDGSMNGPFNFHPKVPGLNPHLEPFYQPAEQGKALCLRADVMDSEEVQEFREYSRAQIMYLGIRNLIIALWNLNCKKWLTVDDVAASLFCRGLARVRCMWESARIIKFLTLRGLINIGLVSAPQSALMVSHNCGTEVIVIGAGAAGLGAARHLKNFGLKVTVLEARDRIGGRIWDDNSFGVCIGKGAQIVTGVINNPTSIICEQANLPMRYLLEKCDLYQTSGEVVDSSLDSQMELHFNAALDAVANWRKSAKEDQSLYDKVWEMHNLLLTETQMSLDKEKMKVFHFHLSNLEYACGINLREVSALNWDQNEAYEQFAGDHTMLRLGYSTIMKKLSDDVDVRLNMIVTQIDYSGNKVKVICKSGEEYVATHVLVTVPLAILKSGDIEFRPALPEWKQTALSHLGAGVIEKVVLEFPFNFWAKKIRGADFFGFVPSKPHYRGHFPVFCDMNKCSEESDTKAHILMTFLCGDAAKLTFEKTDDEIIHMCVDVLKSIFMETEIPQPTKYFVTRWSQDPFSRMVYSYVRIGGSGDSYDQMAADVNGKIFFAGEATNRRFPQTVAGAYISGLREASKIFKSMN